MRADRWDISRKRVVGWIQWNPLKNHTAANLLLYKREGGERRLICLGCLITHTALQAHRRRSLIDPWLVLFGVSVTTRRDHTAENTEQRLWVINGPEDVNENNLHTKKCWMFLLLHPSAPVSLSYAAMSADTVTLMVQLFKDALVQFLYGVCWCLYDYMNVKIITNRFILDYKTFLRNFYWTFTKLYDSYFIMHLLKS